MAEAFRSLLGRGETLLQGAIKKQRGFPKPLPATYSEARYRLFHRLEALAAEIGSLPQALRFSQETVLTLRLHPDFLSAAFDPDRFLALIPSVTKIGVRAWRARLEEVTRTAHVERELARGKTEAMGRLLFVAVDATRFVDELRHVLEMAESHLSQAVKNDLQRIEKIDFLSPSEQIPAAGFAEEWSGSRIEAVLHPLPLPWEERKAHFLKQIADLGLDPAKVRFRFYPNAPTFVSLPFTPGELERLQGYNPLRTARPIEMAFPMLRAGPTLAAPKPPTFQTDPATAVDLVRVALFDGGFDETLPLLAHYAVTAPDSPCRLPPHPDCVAHGTAVAGAILHGALNAASAHDTLPVPPALVVGYRVFPLSDPTDFDLYEAIDAIEEIAPSLRSKGIKVVNLSFGPRGPISDDNISRFTYALDRLACECDLLPIVAVGNDGAAPDGGRLQAPADSVNSLSVGAWSHFEKNRYPVAYSCRGPGREGAKGKPDLAAYGGCERTPIHLVSARPGRRVLDHGTSFAAPLVTRRCAELLAKCPGLSPLLLRALLIHHSQGPSSFDYMLGHGFCPDDVDAMIGCPPKTVSILIDHALPPKTCARFPIPLPADSILPGLVDIAWTLVVLSPVDPASSLEYTSSSIAATFYPDSRIHTFTPPAFFKPRPLPRRLNVVTQAEEAATLLAAGWTQSELPVSRSANAYREDAGLRGTELKWDTVTRSRLTIRGDGLHEPFLLLQADARHGRQEPVRFAGIMTLKAPKAEADIYDAIVRSYPSLEQVVRPTPTLDAVLKAPPPGLPRMSWPEDWKGAPLKLDNVQ